MALLLLLAAGRGARADGPVDGSPPEADVSWRVRDGRLRSLYRPKFVPAEALLEEATVFGIEGVDLGVDGLRGRLVVTGPDGAVGSARDALDWLDAPTPEVLVKVAVVETTCRDRRQVGGHFLFDRDVPAGGPETFFRGLRADFEPEDWLRAELVGGRFEGTSLGFGSVEGDGPAAGTVEQALRFLAHGTEAEFLAEPSLVCTLGVPAAVESSVLVPVPIVQRKVLEDAQRKGFEEMRGFLHERAGVRLEVTVDRVGADSVTLRLHPWLGQLTTPISGIGAQGAPVLDVREMETALTVSDGDTVLVGGLEHLRRSRTREGVPGPTTPWGLEGLLAAGAREGEKVEVLFLVGVRILTPGREHGGTLPPGEAERLMHRHRPTRARILPPQDPP